VNSGLPRFARNDTCSTFCHSRAGGNPNYFIKILSFGKIKNNCKYFSGLLRFARNDKLYFFGFPPARE
jgi:hypothetical protein